VYIGLVAMVGIEAWCSTWQPDVLHGAMFLGLVRLHLHIICKEQSAGTSLNDDVAMIFSMGISIITSYIFR
jgi:hypothetical protein